MSSGIFYPGVGADDGFWNSNNDFYDASVLAFGKGAVITADSFVRFVNVTIPAGATIDEAYVRFTAYYTDSAVTVYTNVHFEDSANAVAPTTAAEGEALSLTAAIPWDSVPTWTDGNTYDTPELKTILQGIIDDGGWASGQAVMALVKDDGSSANAERVGSDIDFDSGSEKPEFHVTWHVVHEGTLTEAATIDETLAVGVETALTEAATIDETLAVGVETALTEAATIADVLLLSSDLEIAEDTELDDTITAYREIDVTITETLDLIDTPVTGWGEVVSDTIDAVDVVMPAVAVPVTESLVLAETLHANWTGTEAVESLLNAIDKALVGWGKTVSDTVDITDAVLADYGKMVQELLDLTETLHANWTGTEAVESTLHIMGQLIVGEIFNDTATDSITIVDAITNLHEMISAIADTIDFGETLTVQAEFNPLIVEAVAITGVVGLLTNLYNANTESLVLTDTIGFAWSDTVTETLTIVDDPVVLAYCMNALTESLVLTETVLQQFEIDESVSDVIEFATTVVLQQILQASVEETLNFGIVLELDGELWETWVLNTNQFNASVYSGYNFNSYAIYNNTAYGCKPDGIYKLSGTTDDGNAFKSGIVLPETYFGTSKKKRFRKAFFGLSGGVTPAIRMETDSGSQTYTIVNSKANITRNLYGRVWTLKIQDFDDLDFLTLCPLILSS